jgi:hypothetical protein
VWRCAYEAVGSSPQIDIREIHGLTWTDPPWQQRRQRTAGSMEQVQWTGAVDYLRLLLLLLLYQYGRIGALRLFV